MLRKLRLKQKNGFLINKNKAFSYRAFLTATRKRFGGGNLETRHVSADAAVLKK